MHFIALFYNLLYIRNTLIHIQKSGFFIYELRYCIISIQDNFQIVVVAEKVAKSVSEEVRANQKLGNAKITREVIPT